MANDVEFRSFVSKVYLTRSINANSPSFLERNLRHALDSHERELARERATANSNAPAAMLEPRRTRSHAWDPPSDRIMDELMQANKAKVRIKSISLQDPARAAASSGRQVKKSQSRDQPEWLQEPDQLRVPCQVVVTVNDVRSQKRTISTAARQGTITKHGRSTFDITFKDCFVISADDLKSHTSSFTEAGHWTKALHKNHSMEFGIHCQDSDDTAEFLSQLEGRPITEFLTAPGNEGIVKCNWAGLPGLPDSEEALPLHRAKGHHEINLKYVARIDMAWNKRESPLTTYNKVLRRARNEARRLTTPSEDLERAGGKTLVKYAYRQGLETKGMPVNHLRCIFCTQEPEHATFERLHLHYLTRHDHFQYEIRLEVDHNGDDLRTIRISHEDDRPTTNEKEFEWEAPHRAFDISAHLEGTNSWTVRNTKKTNSKGAGKHHKVQPTILARPKKRDIAPEDVEEIPTCIKKRHVVPRVPGVKFYRTKSKQSVKPGTELSDSEDDVDETWQLQHQQKQRARLGASKVAQQFNELFNKHLDVEGQPQSDVLVRDAVVRFVRQHAKQLAQPGWREEFDSKLKLLQRVNIVDAATVEYCHEELSEWEHDLDGRTLNSDETEDQLPKARAQTATPSKRRVRGAALESSVADPKDVHMESPSNRVVPEPPTDTPSTKNRKRWAGGRMKSTSAEPPDPQPLGQRTLIVIRQETERQAEKSTGELPITDFTKDGDSQKPIDEIRSADLDYKKFLRVLDNDLIYIRNVDNIVCISNATVRPIVDENDWHEALRMVQAESTGPIQFQIGPLDFIMNSQARTPKKGTRKTEAPVETAKQKASIAVTAATSKRKPCVCGEFVSSKRHTIGCGNPRCYRDFHMACVQLQKRSMAWLCMDCSS
ncbi:hypothetical protein CLAFUW4_03251 [Fulvia fulva]|uniref:Zinc finger PHD-type domain-containing protein n=1 Tax=Passalora fulva TaxID=5499 RepID=A0A9Q8LBD1_PASFU|nr:uncharacterized protein CLAFUR5_03234 [Fulvia fulva]KAK4631448.1 hypothetical protein CLAFUR4_03240 [Fulvia fulva]KAK4632631.1 hypothetical protein CLAFUR0_03244 [Fulvia fulva]UJO14246.1 hypothetical protein CLAFUR5_03234 [Fulvia fulva]WPV12013.1 hypothetical protein CLAFUW4_03251 [Fulvia fulva]WPV26659.1 hypothetical protein CLAFUW7_03244 [Fulvia fulva]